MRQYLLNFNVRPDSPSIDPLYRVSPPTVTELKTRDRVDEDPLATRFNSVYLYDEELEAHTKNTQSDFITPGEIDKYLGPYKDHFDKNSIAYPITNLLGLDRNSVQSTQAEAGSFSADWNETTYVPNKSVEEEVREIIKIPIEKSVKEYLGSPNTDRKLKRIRPQSTVENSERVNFYFSENEEEALLLPNAKIGETKTTKSIYIPLTDRSIGPTKLVDKFMKKLTRNDAIIYQHQLNG
jgi:hypothetical protein